MLKWSFLKRRHEHRPTQSRCFEHLAWKRSTWRGSTELWCLQENQFEVDRSRLAIVAKPLRCGRRKGVHVPSWRWLVESSLWCCWWRVWTHKRRPNLASQRTSGFYLDSTHPLPPRSVHRVNISLSRQLRQAATNLAMTSDREAWIMTANYTDEHKKYVMVE